MTITTDNKFSQVPEWVIRSDISDGAFRLYAVLLRYADQNSKEAYPGRKRLGRDLRKSDRSIDAYLKELVGIGAVIVTRRFIIDGESRHPTSNRYTVITANPKFVAPPGEEEFATPGEEEFATPGEEEFATPGEADFALTIPTLNDTHLNDIASRRKPRRALPPNWAPNTRHQQTAQTRNLDLTREAHAFRNHAESVDRRLADWDRGFDNWLLKAHPRKEESTIWNT